MAHDSKTTINDIAKAVGVSKTTVSRYINGHEEMMSEATRMRIRAVIEMTNFQPNNIARNLKRKKTNLIGVLLADMSTPFSSALVVSIGEYLAAHGYIPIFANASEDLGREEAMIDTLLANGVSGLLVNTASMENQNLIQIACQGIPVVLCDRYINNYNFNIVTIEQDAPFFELLKHLKNQGYTRPVLFTQPWTNNSTRYRRKSAFLSAVKKIYDYDASDDIYVVDCDSKNTTSAQLDHLIANLRPGEIPAIIGVNSVTTIQLYKAIKSRGLNMPTDIGLCGPEDWNWQPDMNWAQLVEPNITTICVPAKDLGTNAAKLITNIITGNKLEPQEIILPCKLIIRASTSRL